jgi:hypothetical protein
MDKNFAGLQDRLESYMADQDGLRKKKVNVETDFFAGLERRNHALSTGFKVF